MVDVFEQQLQAVIDEHADALGRSRHSDASDVLNDTEVRNLQTRCLAAIQRVAGKDSVYYENALGVGESYGSTWDRVAGQIGVAKSLLSDVQNGYLKSLVQQPATVAENYYLHETILLFRQMCLFTGNKIVCNTQQILGYFLFRFTPQKPKSVV